MLAARILLEQDIHVEGLNIFTGFCVEGHTHAIRNKDRKETKAQQCSLVGRADRHQTAHY